MNQNILVCVICQKNNGENVIGFNKDSLKKTKEFLKIRQQRGYKFSNVILPPSVTPTKGYHSQCYRLFTALKKDPVKSSSTLSEPSTSSSSKGFHDERNMPSQKNTVTQYCNGCLSGDRNLAPIDAYQDIYLRIMKVDTDESKSLIKDPLLCWECVAMLGVAQKFNQRAKIAQEILSKNYVNKLAKNSYSLSTLASFVNVEQVIKIHEEEKYQKDTKVNCNYIKTFDIVKVENETKLKEETTFLELEFLKEECSSDNMDNVLYEPEIYYDPSQNENILKNSIKEEKTVDIKENENVALKTSIVQVPEDNGRKETELQPYQKRSRNEKLNKHKLKYKIVVQDNELDVFYKKIDNINENEMHTWIQRELNVKNKAKTYKCTQCFQGFKHQFKCQQHFKKWHSQLSGSFECDICKKRFRLKESLISHVKGHYSKYKCLLCGHETYYKCQILIHNNLAHRRLVVCLTCGMEFRKCAEFYQHYSDHHSRVICDYCGKGSSTKHLLSRHIRLHHLPHKCEECNRTFSSKNSLLNHKIVTHLKEPTEDAYCVECDIQFDNVVLFKRHMKTSIKHKTIVGIPCPECDKVYQKKTYMNNHYKLVHLKKTNHFCAKCSKYFLNGFQYRRHIASIHEKIPKTKDKICAHCGRGFSTNCILIKHIRTHTGERPFVCDVCSASFTQKTALVTHRRSVHKLDLKSQSV